MATAKELLEKYDERGKAKELIQQLGLQNSLENRLTDLSGGELQRIAVAVAASRESDFYFFDEPSSYNDVFQRIGVARVIQDLAKIGKSVMVVEHDLTLLDYLSDFIEILYGEPAAYGIVANMLSTKVGINVFLMVIFQMKMSDSEMPHSNLMHLHQQMNLLQLRNHKLSKTREKICKLFVIN